MQSFRDVCAGNINIEDISHIPVSIESATRWKEEGYVTIVESCRPGSTVHVKLTDEGVKLFRSLH